MTELLRNFHVEKPVEKPTSGTPPGVDWVSPGPPSQDPVAVGTVVEALLSGFAGSSQKAGSKTRKPLFSSDQTYLTEKVNARFLHRLTWGGLMKLNKGFGEDTVTSAMRDACLANGTGSAYAYVLSICRESA